ncbi:hypothetical protein REG_1968 [Candidatus Regiella insecticola LSR1]|uniref:Uncharacterized protein n=1 Tax=Candidatus Regiella insecticola LSR1 TaxID=663321 RepID=E0WV53_9ENTR|nr:hypothetical protein [Candidatus Regiella insecticola]EFL91114.1 hypothetical protein REG_1968 [Candidatus Regiella insecticola LSR1]
MPNLIPVGDSRIPTLIISARISGSHHGLQKTGNSLNLIKTAEMKGKVGTSTASSQSVESVKSVDSGCRADGVDTTKDFKSRIPVKESPAAKLRRILESAVAASASLI